MRGLGAFEWVLAVLVFWSGELFASELPLNEQPMYAYDAPKSEEMLKSDEAFIEWVLSQGTREEGVVEVIELGWRYFAQGDPGAAMKRFNQAYLLDPRYGEAYADMAAIVDVRDENKEEAEELFERAVGAEIRTVGSYMNFAIFLSTSGRDDDAVRVLTDGLSFDPDGHSLKIFRGMLYGKSGQEDKAQREIRQGCEGFRGSSSTDHERSELGVVCAGVGVPLE